ncbi:amino acid-binding protein [Sporanaerobium hydrogeniformans]|uniref:Amino acid-binding protein n=1 Tax=Sporanaerobium hydrogeniformans TaxID=3072179 RepID=A0AC61DG98_9FIRM|nr:ABC transporter substrate-binding protein [Sporanaerobium hydrogeniformans]PHV71997.1 amino acid-binding protein [Sporanaerobium hydrogeniformans]
MILKRVSAIAISMLMAVSMAGCGAKAPSNEGEGASVATNGEGTIKIGLITPKTGSVAQYGIAVDNATALAVKEINEAGGINGREIELISYDNKGDATESINLFNRLVDNDEIVALLGPVISSNALAIGPLADEKGIPMITPTGTSLDITPGYDYVYRACYTDPYQGSIMAKFANENLKVKTASILYNTGSDYSVGLAEAFKETFEAAGGTITNYEGYTADDKEFKAVLTNIKAGSPEVLFIPDYYNTVGLIAGQVKEVGLDTIMLGGDGWDGVQENYGELVEGSYFVNHYAADDTAEIVKNFVDNYTEMFEGTRPNAFAALGYDATKILAAAIEKAGTEDKAAIKDAIAATDMDCVTGHVTFDENGDPQKSVTILKMKDGVSVLETKVQ